MKTYVDVNLGMSDQEAIRILRAELRRLAASVSEEDIDSIDEVLHKTDENERVK